MVEQHLSDVYVVIVGYVFRSRRVPHLQQVKTNCQYGSLKDIAYYRDKSDTYVPIFTIC